MSGSRLLPVDRRRALPPAPTTSRWWRGHVLLRSWLNRHHRWLAPALVCAPPVGVAMLWAGATRPGHRRRWVTAGAAAWTLALVLGVVLLALPGAQPADADAAPTALAGGPAPVSSAVATSVPTPAASRAATPAPAARPSATGPGVGAAPVPTSAPAADPAPTRSAAPAAGAGPTGGASAPAAPRTSAPAASAPVTRDPAPGAPGGEKPVATPTRPRPVATPPTPRRTPVTPPRTTPQPPAIPTAMPFTACSREGAVAISPHGLTLGCLRTPLGLFWLWH